MDHATYVDHLRRDAAALLDAAEPDLGRRVPGCPDWDVADLVWHIAVVHHRWGSIAERGWTSKEETDAGYVRPERPGEGDLVAFAREQADHCVEVLSGLDPATPSWNWTTGRQDVGWIARRMAHETAVHRVDAEQAAGRDGSLEPELAADGLDEFLQVFLPRRGDYAGASGYLGVLETDTGRAWAVHLDPPTAALVSPMKVPKKARDIEQLSGPASPLLLWLWGRAERRDAGPLARALREHVAGS